MSRSISPYERYGEFTPIEDAGLRTHVFRAGETIWGLGELYYNDWELGRLIAERNDLDDLRNVELGRVLIVPARPLKRGLFESA